MGIVLFISALKIKQETNPKSYFQKMMSSCVRISFIAGLFLTLGVAILFLIQPTYAPMKFGVVPGSFGQALTVGIMLLTESVVFGGILNFIIFQFTKHGAERVRA